MTRLLDCLRHHERDILAGVMHAVVAERKAFFIPDAAAALLFLWRRLELRHVQMRQQRQDTRHGLRRLCIDRGDFSLSDVALDRPAVRAFRHFELDGVFRRAGDFQPAIHAASSRPQNIFVGHI